MVVVLRWCPWGWWCVYDDDALLSVLASWAKGRMGAFGTAGRRGGRGVAVMRGLRGSRRRVRPVLRLVDMGAGEHMFGGHISPIEVTNWFLNVVV